MRDAAAFTDELPLLSLSGFFCFFLLIDFDTHLTGFEKQIRLELLVMELFLWWWFNTFVGLQRLVKIVDKVDKNKFIDVKTDVLRSCVVVIINY